MACNAGFSSYANATSQHAKTAHSIASITFAITAKLHPTQQAYESEKRGLFMVRRSVLEQIFKEMMHMRQRLDDIENSFSGWNPQPIEVPESELMSLPDHLRRTYMVVASRGECDAVTVSNKTGRCRAIESNYLNQLARMGWLEKRRVSKTAHFHLMTQKALKQPKAVIIEKPPSPLVRPFYGSNQGRTAYP
jgi:hypothetical protein